MTSLTIYDAADPFGQRHETHDRAEIAERLKDIGVRLELWEAAAELAEDSDDEAVLAAYRADIDRLMAEGGYRAVDVMRLLPDHPEKDALRAKFLNEHRHDDDEVRFFVEGSGKFYLRTEDAVHAVVCTRGDLISVPANARHWFDMGPEPHFTAIRLYTSPEGWVANFTGDPIASGIPTYEASGRAGQA